MPLRVAVRFTDQRTFAQWEWPVKKGRHRRFEEARALKHTTSQAFDELLSGGREEPCPECDALPGADHASWCRFEETNAED